MQTKVTGFHTEGDLSIVQLGTSIQDSFDYIACERALQEKMIEAKELDAAGSVNTIFVLNNSDKFVFLMDGDILAGAKQNRVVNTSILLAPKSKTQIPVSCVERGRWRNTSGSFKGTPATAPMSLRADKARQVQENLKQRRGFASNQGEIWGKVEEFHISHQVESSTSNLSDIFDKKEVEFGELIKRFLLDPNANGMAVFFGNKLAGIDVFNRRDVFREYFPKLLRGAAFESASVKTAKKLLTEAEAGYRTLEVMDKIEEQKFEEQHGVGVGLDRRFGSEGLSGFELAYDKCLIHLAVFLA
jgi:hypothetical protein